VFITSTPGGREGSGRGFKFEGCPVILGQGHLEEGLRVADKLVNVSKKEES